MFVDNHIHTNHSYDSAIDMKQLIEKYNNTENILTIT